VTGEPTLPLYHIDRQDKLPLYEQIERNLRQLILDGVLQPGQAVPPEWDLADLYGVSRLTVRRALDELVRQDWLSRRHGVGTFVSRPVVASIPLSKLSFTQEMQAIGRRPSSRLLSSRVITRSGALSMLDETAQGDAAHPLRSGRVAQRLGVEEDQPLVEIVRLRLADDLPILYEYAYLSAERFPGLETDPALAQGSLYERLATRYGVVVARIDQTLKAVLLSEEAAHWLEAPAGAPSIYSESVAYAVEGDMDSKYCAVEYSWSVAHNEHSEFYFSFRRGES
jgi:GntR family transcriptional regulator